LWRDAQGREGSIDLTGNEAVIGRAVDCAIRTDDAMVSRHHARLVWQGGQYFLEDLGSANGVFFQERRVARHPLKHGDAVRCGSLWIRFIDAGGYQPGPMAQRGGLAAPARPAGLPQSMSPQAPLHSPPPEPMGYGQKSGRTAYLPPEDSIGAGPAQPPIAPMRPGIAPAVHQQHHQHQPMDTPGFSGVSPMPEVAGPGGLPSPAREAARAASEPAALSSREVMHLQRRVEQLKAELRVYRGGGDKAATYEELEEDIDNLTRERNELRRKVMELEQIMAEDSGNAQVRRAGAIAKTAAETVGGLNDVLSNLRINIMAAEGEFEQFATTLPRASFELIREALRSSASDMEVAREMLRELRRLAGLS